MASGYRSSIQLFTQDESVKSDNYYRDVGTLEEAGFDYVKLKVVKESGMGAVWLVYSEPSYGRNQKGTCKPVFPDQTGIISPGFTIRSIQAFDITDPCVCLFEHSIYRGNKLATAQGVEDIRKAFPSGEVAGMSSAIAMSGLWGLYTKPSFGGPHKDLDATQGRQLEEFFDGFNDVVQSVKLVRAGR